MIREPLRDRVKGRWHGVLPQLGVPAQFLNRKHQPCPLCGGTDRARFDDKDGNGTWICSHCGAGDGIALVMKLHGWDYKRAAEEIEKVAGMVEPEAARPAPDPGKQIGAMRRTWNAARPIGDTVRRYLVSRGLRVQDLRDLRQAGNDMLALVRGSDGKGGQVHRTRLTADGRKAEDPCRLFMPGSMPKGAAVRLMPHEDTLGIAEGIETALSAAVLFKVPCWASLNAGLMRTWEPPGAVKRVLVFADNDTNFTGQRAAYELANRLASKVEVAVKMPGAEGVDWNDVLVGKPEAIVAA
jgi:putative DNA primase/helicase